MLQFISFVRAEINIEKRERLLVFIQEGYPIKASPSPKQGWIKKAEGEMNPGALKVLSAMSKEADECDNAIS